MASAKKLHYAWIVAGVTFVVLLLTAGIRAAPGVLIVPLESEFHWSRATISFAVAVNLLLYGLIGPFAAAVIDRWGVRRTMTLALAVTAAGIALTPAMRQSWQLVLLWGVVVGAGCGVVGNYLAALVAARWFRDRQGLVVGVLTASNAAGQLVFLPTMAEPRHPCRLARDVVRADRSDHRRPAIGGIADAQPPGRCRAGAVWR